MTVSARERSRVSYLVLLVSATAWVILLIDAGNMSSHAHGLALHSGASHNSFKMLLAMNPPSGLAAGWALMLAAMMAPTLITPLRYILEHSFKRRRLRLITLFSLGYAAIWMAAGCVLLAAGLALSLLAPQSYLPAIGVGLIAFVWQCSPIKQRCLNRHHNHSKLAAFGFAADWSALRFGILHGAWCVASCWALMLLPMLLAQAHVVAMAAVTLLMISERLEYPRPLSWRLRGPGKLWRIVATQTRIRLQKLLSGSVPSVTGA